jgi:hypothetical protein
MRHTKFTAENLHTYKTEHEPVVIIPLAVLIEWETETRKQIERDYDNFDSEYLRGRGMGFHKCMRNLFGRMTDERMHSAAVQLLAQMDNELRTQDALHKLQSEGDRMSGDCPFTLPPDAQVFATRKLHGDIHYNIVMPNGYTASVIHTEHHYGVGLPNNPSTSDALNQLLREVYELPPRK